MRWILLVLATGCATDATPASSTGGKADGSQAELIFAGDFTESLRGELRAGDTVAVTYDLDRLQTCRGYTNGSDAWGVGGFAQFDGGTPVSFAVSALESGETRPVTAQLHIPATATSVAIWFEQTDVFGCHAYDSNDSSNYGFDISAAAAGAVEDFGDTVSLVDVHAGDSVVVHYDPARLATCESSSGGHAKWSITGHWQVDGGTAHTLAVTTDNGGDLVASDPSFVVPHGKDLALWFDATSVYGCHAYDSADGANFHVAIKN